MAEEDTRHGHDAGGGRSAKVQVEVARKLLRQRKEYPKLGEIAVHQHNLRRVSRHRCGPVQRDGNMRLSHGQGIVNAIADKADLPSLLLQLCHQLRFALRQGIGKIAGHAQRLR